MYSNQKIHFYTINDDVFQQHTEYRYKWFFTWQCIPATFWLEEIHINDLILFKGVYYDKEEKQFYKEKVTCFKLCIVTRLERETPETFRVGFEPIKDVFFDSVLKDEQGCHFAEIMSFELGEQAHIAENGNLEINDKYYNTDVCAKPNDIIVFYYDKNNNSKDCDLLLCIKRIGSVIKHGSMNYTYELEDMIVRTSDASIM